MNNNAKFLTAISNETATEIADHIASAYGITRDAAIDEVIAEGAYNLLEYLSGSVRLAVSALMKRHGF
jgi:hypothetical protein